MTLRSLVLLPFRTTTLFLEATFNLTKLFATLLAVVLVVGGILVSVVLIVLLFWLIVAGPGDHGLPF